MFCSQSNTVINVQVILVFPSSSVKGQLLVLAVVTHIKLE